MSRHFVLLAAVVALGAAPALAPAQSDPRTTQVDRIFARWDRPGSPGCAVGVASQGKLVYQRGYGTANLDYDVPLSTGSVLYIASVSKQFTAATMALLAADGRISLDDDVRKYIPELPDYGERITIRHLIHHTSGIRDYLALMGMAGMRLGDTHSDQEVLELIARQMALNFRPGERHLYNNSGYFLMSEIVKRVTGKSLREFADERIFRPLGMHSTHFHDDHTMVVKNRALSYSPDPDGGFEIDYWANFDKVGSGGLLSTVEDLFLWDQNFYEPKVGGPEFLDQLHTRGVLNGGDTLDYAFGLVHGEYRGLRTVSHGGSSMGFRTHLLRFPDQRVSVIVLCNLGTTDPADLAREVADVYLSRSYTSAYAEEPSPTRRPVEERETTAALRSRLAGRYHSDELRIEYSILDRDGRLVLRRKAAADAPLRFLGDDTFRAGSWELKFDPDGRAFTVDAGRAYRIRFQRTGR
jgi:CubicO group peptidase (beta-lactamase class C family)